MKSLAADPSPNKLTPPAGRYGPAEPVDDHVRSLPRAVNSEVPQDHARDARLQGVSLSQGLCGDLGDRVGGGWVQAGLPCITRPALSPYTDELEARTNLGRDQDRQYASSSRWVARTLSARYCSDSRPHERRTPVCAARWKTASTP